MHQFFNHSYFLSAFSSKLVDILLQFLHENANMVAVTNGVMYLYRQRKHPFAGTLEILTHGENGQKKLLDTFLQNGAISRAQYDKSFGDLRDLMEMQGVE